MIDAGALATLRSVLGADAVEEHAACEVDGVAIGVTLRPRDATALAAGIESLRERGMAAVVRGAGSQLGFGNPPRRPDVFLSTERLRGIDAFEPAEGVCHVRAGTPVREVRVHVNAGGWELPLDPVGDAATVGGTLATAAVGPRVQAFGPPRDAVLGLEVALATGGLAHCGGRVVKNVTGYDMNKLYTGSFGTLGVIASAWLRLRPLPRSVRCFESRAGAVDTGSADALAAARLNSTRAAALLATPSAGGDLRIVVELAGDVAAVEQDSTWLRAELGAEEVAPQRLEEVRERQAGLAGPGGLRFRIAALPSRHPALLAALASGGAATQSYPGSSLVYAGFPLAADAPTAVSAAAFACAISAAERAGGSVRCESAPAAAKYGRDVHGEFAPWLPLFEALKSRFDPSGVLNPGRFAGGL